MLRGVFILGLALVLAGPAKAETYHFVTLDFPPLEFKDDKALPQGAAVDIVKEALTRLGHKVEIQVLPWTRSLNLTREGRADGIFTAYKNAEREAFLDYSNEILIPQVVSLYTKKGSKLRFSGDFKDVAGKIIGTLSTISYGTRFDEARTKLHLKTDRVEELELNFKKLVAGRVDYVISNRYSAEVEIERLGMKDLVEEQQVPVEITPSFVAFSKKNKLTSLRDQFDKTLRAMKHDGKYDAILMQYKVRIPKESH